MLERRKKHCYALTVYEMSASRGEKVYGAFANIETYSGSVPLYLEGDRINDWKQVWSSPRHPRAGQPIVVAASAGRSGTTPALSDGQNGPTIDQALTADTNSTTTPLG
jgi:hypothetical protein